MELIIIQDPGHGDSTLPIHLISDGDSDGAIARVGSVLVLVMDTDMDIMDMATRVVDGGDLLFIILPVGADGMEDQGLTDSMETISMCTAIFM
jgi:hypothetical protein